MYRSNKEYSLRHATHERAQRLHVGRLLVSPGSQTYALLPQRGQRHEGTQSLLLRRAAIPNVCRQGAHERQVPLSEWREVVLEGDRGKQKRVHRLLRLEGEAVGVHLPEVLRRLEAAQQHEAPRRVVRLGVHLLNRLNHGSRFLSLKR